MSMKDAYQQKLRSQLDEWDAELNRLKAKADMAKADIQIEYNKQIKALQSKRDEAGKKLAELEQASDDAWVDLKSGIENAWESLGQALKSASSRFK
ncbi:sll1863 family stress response protein [Zobellella maritima]|uniref:coiled coil domain-containing protein n=1 Tax=Zobellella maritima TaxID=2059725 RepID=UPI000E306F9E|nr:coiled coil domain-containing protein [Zobellella maritima]